MTQFATCRPASSRNRKMERRFVLAKVALICSVSPLCPCDSFSLSSLCNFREISQPAKVQCAATLIRHRIHKSTPALMSTGADGEQRLLGSRRLHNAFKVNAPAGETSKDLQTPTPSVAHGDWGKVLPLPDRPRRPPLDRLSEAELRRILNGERLQKQSRNGRTGHGIVVSDVKADAALVFAVLSDIEHYPLRVPTVREASVQYNPRNDKVCKAQFKLSRFRLEINAELRCLRDRNLIEFRLDSERENPVLEQARGFWFVEDAAPYGREPGWTRVWLVADVTCSPLLPAFLIDYAASRALPRATTWLAPALSTMPGGAADLRVVLSDGLVPATDGVGHAMTALAVVP